MRSFRLVLIRGVGALLLLSACQSLLVLERQGNDADRTADATVENGADVDASGTAVEASSDASAIGDASDANADVLDGSVSGCNATIVSGGSAFCDDFSGPTLVNWPVEANGVGSVDLVASGRQGQGTMATVDRPAANPCHYARGVHSVPAARHVVADYWTHVAGPDDVTDEFVVVQSVANASEKCLLLTAFQFDGVGEYKVHLIEKHINLSNGAVINTAHGTGGTFSAGAWSRITTDFDLVHERWSVAVNGADAGSGALAAGCATAQTASVALGPDCVGPGSGPTNVRVKFDDVRIEWE